MSRHGFERWAILLLFAAGCSRSTVSPEVQRNIGLLQQPEERTRRRALQSLTEMGPSAAAAIPAVTAVVEGSTSTVRGEAIIALVSLDPGGRRAVPSIVAALKETDPELKELAAIALGLLGAAGDDGYTQVERLTQDAKPEVRAAASYAAAKLRPTEQNVRRLYSGLASDEPRVRFMALRAMREIGPEAVRELPPLLAALRDSNLGVAQEAAQTLSQLGAKGREAMGDLLQAIDTPELSDSAMNAILAIDRDGGEAAPGLRACVEHCSTVEARGRAVQALANYPALTLASIPALLRGLNDADPRVGLSALNAIQILRPAYAELRVGLLSAMQSPNSPLAWKATEVAAEYGPEALNEMSILQAGSKRNRLQAAYGLGRMPQTPATREALSRARSDASSDVREQVTLALTEPAKARTATRQEPLE